MRFWCSPNELLEASEKVMKLTSVTENYGEVAIETAADEVVVYRNTSEVYSQHHIPANIVEPGSCVAANLSPLRCMKGDAEFWVDGSLLRVGGITLPLAEPGEKYARLTPIADFASIPPEAFGVTWLMQYGKNTGNLSNEVLFIDHDVIGCHVSEYWFSSYKLDEPVFDGCVALQYFHQGELAIAKDKVWIRDGDFMSRIQTMDVPPVMRDVDARIRAIPTIASISITPGVINAIEQMGAFTKDATGVIAYTGGDNVVFESRPELTGYMCERRPVVVTGEPFNFCFPVPKLKMAIGKTPLPRLEFKRNVSGEYSQILGCVVSSDGKMISTLVERRPDWDLKYMKETKND